MKNHKISRRTFMQVSASAVSGVLYTAGIMGCQSTRNKADIPVGMQLYCVREECKVDLPGTVAKIAEMGYDGVEFADYFEYSAVELRKILDDNGLKCCGSHIYLEALLGEDDIDWKQAFEICESTGGTEWYIIEYEVEGIPPLDAMRMNLDNLRKMRSKHKFKLNDDETI